YESEARTIHQIAIDVLGMEACIVALGVARDLRSGKIPPEEYDQGTLWGTARRTACCIEGHIRRRMGRRIIQSTDDNLIYHGRGLFAGSNPSDPILAADAIERFVYDGSQSPWAP